MNPATRHLSLLFIALVIALTAAAAPQQRQKKDREEWNREMRQFKHEFFARELGLTEEQQTKFFPLYDAKDDECRGLRRQMRKAAKELEAKGASASDEDFQQATENVRRLEEQINAIEQKYVEQYKEILTSKQMYQLKDVERKFAEFVRNQRHERKTRH